MTLLRVDNLTRYYGAVGVFAQVSFQVHQGEHVSLVGVNGAGKSTLLKIIGGLDLPDEGQVQVLRGRRVAYLPQEPRFVGGRTLWQEMEAALAALLQLQDELRTLEQRIAETNAPDWDATMERYGELSARFEHAGGYQMEQRIASTLQILGFAPAQYDQPLTRLSGGQKTRAALASTLLSDPDVLLLDEPTNHLDLGALEWLDSFLKGWPGTLIVISHDRYFLDRVTSRTLEIEGGCLYDYPAGYSGYLALKAERLEREMKEYAAQQELIARTEEFIRRYKAGQRSKEAKGREKRLNRLKDQHTLERPREQRHLHLALESGPRSGDRVLALRDLVVGYPAVSPDQGEGDQGGDQTGRPDVSDTSHASHALLSTGRLEIQRGERVALLGPNGSGKTTLLRTLVGEIKPLRGSFQLGANVSVGYFAQSHEGLRMDATVLEEVLRINPHLGETRARTFLGSFLFRGDDVFKQIHTLSGGERNRVALAQLTLKPGNLLILDEPTNHLDISARDALEVVLSQHTGSMLFVSHDRFFIDRLADTLWIIQDGRLVRFDGGYSDYQERQASLREQEKARQPGGSRDAGRSSSAGRGTAGQANAEEKQRKKRIAALEAEVEQLEYELSQAASALESASTAQDVGQVASLGTHYADLEQRLNRCYEDWAALVE
ncbi:MAG: ABC-F family ATP-binding cassette domain-containing protein [Chloroflexaceae bacterium]|nr:ABC-F family ATP-binding cassette domain-containing protein [Chloroflexaceae bacterium]